MKNENEIVTSVWGKITRREMLRNLAVSGLTLGLGVSGLSQIFAADVFTKPDDILAPPKAIQGTPFREITNFQTIEEDLFDIKKLQKNGQPKPRTREAKWFDKPSNALGVSILDFTNSPLSSVNSCAQAACATLLNYHKKAPAGFTGDGITNEILRTHPPNGGARGTSFYFTEKILTEYGLKTWAGISNDMSEQVLTEKLKNWISQGFPCIVLLDMKIPMHLAGTGTMGHFTTVFAYTDTHVFLSNWNYKKVGGWANDWETFKKAWSLPDSQMHHPLLAGWA
jgi:hypothetical protein